MSDLLSASSLLLAVIGVLYGLWYAQITAALDTKVDKHAANRVAPRKRVTSVIFTRALPLALGSVVLSAIFLPDAIAICQNAIVQFGKADYDAVQTALCVVEIFSISLAVHLVSLLIKLIGLRMKLASGRDLP